MCLRCVVSRCGRRAANAVAAGWSTGFPPTPQSPHMLHSICICRTPAAAAAAAADAAAPWRCALSLLLLLLLLLLLPLLPGNAALLLVALHLVKHALNLCRKERKTSRGRVGWVSRQAGWTSMRSTSAGIERKKHNKRHRMVDQLELEGRGRCYGCSGKRARWQTGARAAPAAPREGLKPHAVPCRRRRAPTLLGHLLQALAHHRLLIVIQLLGIRHLLQQRRGMGAKCSLQNCARLRRPMLHTSLPLLPTLHCAAAPTFVATR